MNMRSSYSNYFLGNLPSIGANVTKLIIELSAKMEWVNIAQKSLIIGGDISYILMNKEYGRRHLKQTLFLIEEEELAEMIVEMESGLEFLIKMNTHNPEQRKVFLDVINKFVINFGYLADFVVNIQSQFFYCKKFDIILESHLSSVGRAITP